MNSKPMAAQSGEIMNHLAFSVSHAVIGGASLRLARRRAAPASGGGSGAPLLILNGIGGSMELLTPIAAALTGRDLILFDMPGNGGSEPASCSYDMRDAADLTAAVLDHFGVDEADIMGISWGGMLAQQFARQHPGRCRRLILACTGPGALSIPGHPLALHSLFMKHLFRRRDGERRNSAGFSAQMKAIRGWSSLHWLHRLRHRTLLIAARMDMTMPLANARMMSLIIPDARLAVVEGGHMALVSHPARPAAIIADFLDG